MILVGIDDTDVLGSRGTNQLARDLARHLAPRWTCERILRHQLLVDARVPFTSHNGSASLTLRNRGGGVGPRRDAAALVAALRAGMLADMIEGSDPGLCVATRVPIEVVRFGALCRTEVVEQEQARALAREHGIHLEGLGGTEGGVIGALAAVGLAASGDHGRVVMDATWTGDVRGPVRVAALAALGVEAVVEEATGREVTAGTVDFAGKKLRPNRRGGRTVLFVESAGRMRWVALRRD